MTADGPKRDSSPRASDSPISFSVTCPEAWTDYNGHMNVAFYARAFDEALRHYFDGREGLSSATIPTRSRIEYRREVLLGTKLTFALRHLPHEAGNGDKRIAVFMTAEPADGGPGYLAAMDERWLRF